VSPRGRVERRLRSFLTDADEAAAPAPAPNDTADAGRLAELEAQVDSLQVQVGALEQELDLTRLDPTRWPIAHYVNNRGLTVQAGPFAGLTFPDDLVGHPERSDSLAAKLIGSYERELHPALESALAKQPSVFVNVGAGDGFYPVGVALSCPETTVHAFEIDAGRQATCAALADLNGVADRVGVHGECKPAWLAQLPDDAFLLVDCEGCEATVLDPAQAPPLRHATLIVELHDFITPESSARVVERFSDTQEIERVQSEPRHVDDFPDLEFLGWKQREIAVCEFRFRPMEWAVLTPL
jgi:precorrin-6B methylase 2